MDRASSLRKLLDRDRPDEYVWDIAVIGGGATGMGIAVDAAARGLSVCLLEQSDFGKGTSGRSTKLIHGGVRYLRQGHVRLVAEALREREILRHNAPHLVHDLPFVVPGYRWWEVPYYAAGLNLYDLLAAGHARRSRLLSRVQALAHLPAVNADGLRGGVLYFDGQFDDARLLINLAQTAVEQGAVLVNYAPVIGLTHDQRGRVDGLRFRDAETEQEHSLCARLVINAAGPFGDVVRRLDDPAAPAMLSPSQGAHIVLDGSFLAGGESAILVPRTKDGQVLFVIPWLGHALIGTTDTPVGQVVLEPVPLEREVKFLLEGAGQYLARTPMRADILSVFAGIRPLLNSDGSTRTAELPRDHTIQIGPSGLMTIAGGKWTTYRAMAEDCVDRAMALLGARRKGITRSLRIHGYVSDPRRNGDLEGYGSDAPVILKMIERDSSLGQPLHPALPIRGAQVIWAVRHEMARTVDDVLGRRTRALFLNARAAIAMAPRVASLMAGELGREQWWQEQQIADFAAIAGNYLPTS